MGIMSVKRADFFSCVLRENLPLKIFKLFFKMPCLEKWVNKFLLSAVIDIDIDILFAFHKSK